MAKKRDISVSLLPLVFDSSINRVALIEAFYSQPVSHAKPDLSYAFELLKVNSSPSNSTRLIDLIHFFHTSEGNVLETLPTVIANRTSSCQ